MYNLIDVERCSYWWRKVSWVVCLYVYKRVLGVRGGVQQGQEPRGIKQDFLVPVGERSDRSPELGGMHTDWH